MIVRIDKKDKDIVHKKCLETLTKCTFYTIENLPDMLTVEIEVDSMEMVWYLARNIEAHIQEKESEGILNTVRKRLNL